MWSHNSNSKNESEKLPEYVVIEYPGVVRDREKVIETLGGQQEIDENHFSGRLLRLRYRPSNPYCSTIVSERNSAEKLRNNSSTILCVVNVKRKKCDPGCVDAKIIGMVSTLYTFKSMCDFQYLPLRKPDPSSSYYENLVPKLIPRNLTQALSWWSQPEDKSGTPLFLTPFQFSRYNLPTTKLLRKELDYSKERGRRKTGVVGQSLRVVRKAFSITAMANSEFPSAPKKTAVDNANTRCRNERPHNVLHEIFEERPMWTRVAIMQRTGVENSLLKILLPKYAFYILNGPWGRLWCRFGYDPRTAPEAKMYQTVMVSFPQNTKIPERQRLKAIKTSSTTRFSDQSLPSNNCASAESSTNHIYIPGELPRVRQTWYCICDIKLPIAEEVVRKESFVQGEKADDQNGWLPPRVIERIREEIKDNVKMVTAQMDEIEEDVEVEEEWLA